jgi:hypothetical protein
MLIEEKGPLRQARKTAVCRRYRPVVALAGIHDGDEL